MRVRQRAGLGQRRGSSCRLCGSRAALSCVTRPTHPAVCEIPMSPRQTWSPGRYSWAVCCPQGTLLKAGQPCSVSETPRGTVAFTLLQRFTGVIKGDGNGLKGGEQGREGQLCVRKSSRAQWGDSSISLSHTLPPRDNTLNPFQNKGL